MNTDLYAGKTLIFVTNGQNDSDFDFYYVQDTADKLTPLFISKKSQDIVNNMDLHTKLIKALSECSGMNCEMRVNYNNPNFITEKWAITKYFPSNIGGRNVFYAQLDEHRSDEEATLISGGVKKRAKKSRRHSRRNHSRKTKRHRSNRRK